MNSDKQNFTFQRNVAIVGIALFIAKLFAWYLTKSDAVYSDAMESIVNIIAAFMGLYALYLAAKPKDYEHPYGHGKVEFITAGIEGALIIFAGILIIVEAGFSLVEGSKLAQLDWGIAIMAATGIFNYFIGYLSIKKGEKENSAVLVSSGRHLQSDTFMTAGIVMSLITVYFTKLYWIDAAVALAIGIYIIGVGYKIIRESLRGIMDEANPKMLERMANFLQNNRKPEWIDLHNTRIQQHGSGLHIDAHLTLPYYLELRDAHQEMKELIVLIAENTDRKVEFNVHMDDCKPFSCEICMLSMCPVRHHSLKKEVVWTAENISQVEKHSVNTN